MKLNELVEKLRAETNDRSIDIKEVAGRIRKQVSGFKATDEISNDIVITVQKYYANRAQAKTDTKKPAKADSSSGRAATGRTAGAAGRAGGSAGRTAGAAGRTSAQAGRAAGRPAGAARTVSGAGVAAAAGRTAGPRAGATEGVAPRPRVKRQVTGGPIKPVERKTVKPAEVSEQKKTVKTSAAEKTAVKQEVSAAETELNKAAETLAPETTTEVSVTTKTSVENVKEVVTETGADVEVTSSKQTDKNSEKEDKSESGAETTDRKSEKTDQEKAQPETAKAEEKESAGTDAAATRTEKPKPEVRVITGAIQVAEKPRQGKILDAKTIAERVAASNSRREATRRSSGDRPLDDRRGGRMGERPARPGDRPARTGDRPARTGDRPARTGDRPDGRTPRSFDRSFDNKDKDQEFERRGGAGRGRTERPDRSAAADVPSEKFGKQDRRDRHEKNSRDKERYDNKKDKERSDITSKEQLHGKKNQKNQKAQTKPVKQTPKEPEEPVIRNITLPESLTLKELADKIKQPVAAMIKKLFMEGKMVTVNTELSFDDASMIALEFNYIAEQEEKIDPVEEALRDIEDSEDSLTTRPPVVCVMGHVDHGKTSLLDAIRNSSIQEGEAGGITQQIGAYVVKVGDQSITFLDTPGHEAFTAMRLRGAQATDIAILVVAADDGVMPQTVEAINHAKAAGIEIIVAINKIDKPSANVDRVKQELMEYGLVAEDWGGSTVFCPVSARTHEGISNLLDMILLTAEVLELKANANRKARGVVIEARLDRGRGPVATLLVQKGTLHVGDFVAIGEVNGRVRAMIDHKQKNLKLATPSTPVEITGLAGVPNSGDTFISTETEKEARQISEAFITRGKENLITETKSRMSLDDLFSQMKEGNLKELKLVVKADVQGSVEAVKQSLLKLSNEEIVIKVIHSGVGAINESDVTLASASGAIIIGFNVRPDAQAKKLSDEEKVDVRLYSVIYNAIDDIEAAMKGMLDPIYEERVIAHAEVRQVYKASSIGSIAGSYVLDGTVERNASARITRDGKQIFEGKIASLKRFKDDVKEVKSGFECGIVFESHSDLAEGDQIEVYKMVEIPRT